MSSTLLSGVTTPETAMGITMYLPREGGGGGRLSLCAYACWGGGAGVDGAAGKGCVW